MLRSLALATFLLLTLLWVSTAWGKAGSSSAPSQSTDRNPLATDFAIVAGTAITGGTFITVTTTTDELNSDGDCSLREAIQAAYADAATDDCPAGSGGDTIDVPAGHYTLTLGQLPLTGTVTIQGSITGTTILDGNYFDRVLYIPLSATVTLLHLDIRGGQGPLPYYASAYVAGDGGGVLTFGTALIGHSTIHDNRAGSMLVPGIATYGGHGGGIFNRGILTVTNSTISGNAAGDGASGESHGGQTVCGTAGEGGGIANFGTLTLDNSTVANNEPGERYCEQHPDLVSGNAGGVYNNNPSILPHFPLSTIYVKNSILAGNQISDCGGSMVSLGYNVIQTSANCTITGTYVHWVAHLGPLQDNGGPTLTHALSETSPAIDAGDCTDSTGIAITVDQRGEPRPQGDGCDIGAYESPFTSTFTIQDITLPMIGR